MSAARRRRKGSNKNQSNKGQSNKGQSNKGRSGQKSGGRQNSKKQVGFFGDPAKLPQPTSEVRISTEPAVVPHSLGPPPLPGHETIAMHYFTAIYDKAVTLSGALAAAAGLIEPEELVEEFGE
ncbi:hypothetical protein [Euzebya tangerina]|uniref:hypothetical protein n=1 Tax=Euzebya tangerina TaxID=591198 RepID=UPI000E31A6C4|nr:hypothetical protein [Euzebya tangerina]